MSARVGTPVAAGVAVAVTSATTFGTSGPLAKALIDSGWSSLTVTLVRLGLGTVLIAVPMLVVGRRRLRTIANAPWLVIGYGVFGVAVTQLFFFNAVRHLDVAVALLIEYTAPVLVVGYEWGIRRRRPPVLTLTGCVVALTGLCVVIAGGGSGLGVDPIGVLWGLGAAVGLAGYFIFATDDVVRSPGAVDPLALVCGGLVVGTTLIGLVGATGLLPVRIGDETVRLAGSTVPWWTATVAIALVSTAIAYAAGVVAVRSLGATVASFVSLLEVVSSAVFSWLLLGQTITAWQMVGAATLLAGVVGVQIGGAGVRRSDARSVAPTEPTGTAPSPTRT
ncbi:EamA family transporter [Williamsia sterculiae]|uniref:Threonine/homoserine efflux transporter RhtA n=1 Tax=Williamsia sterculiae TaxID=1344003 RepID=A0A1N7H2K1_9NOCA|nr:DMT family transporter [Williamsia sterculiae]SIS19033.1 Threonine/homoserine efflux transporter RhtA [Williamsia sterculiae]